jgi:hypothetical protein
MAAMGSRDQREYYERERENKEMKNKKVRPCFAESSVDGGPWEKCPRQPTFKNRHPRCRMNVPGPLTPGEYYCQYHLDQADEFYAHIDRMNIFRARILMTTIIRKPWNPK